jgi:hypothetical protein
MPNQLRLLPDEGTAWELDDTTREVGRRGLELARRALREAGARRPAA